MLHIRKVFRLGRNGTDCVIYHGSGIPVRTRCSSEAAALLRNANGNPPIGITGVLQAGLAGSPVPLIDTCRSFVHIFSLGGNIRISNCGPISKYSKHGDAFKSSVSFCWFSRNAFGSGMTIFLAPPLPAQDSIFFRASYRGARFMPLPGNIIVLHNRSYRGLVKVRLQSLQTPKHGLRKERQYEDRREDLSKAHTAIR